MPPKNIKTEKIKTKRSSSSSLNERFPLSTLKIKAKKVIMISAHITIVGRNGSVATIIIVENSGLSKCQDGY